MAALQNIPVLGQSRSKIPVIQKTPAFLRTENAIATFEKAAKLESQFSDKDLNHTKYGAKNLDINGYLNPTPLYWSIHNGETSISKARKDQEEISKKNK